MAETVPQRRTFVRLLGFLRPYKWSLAASVVLAIGSQAAGLSIPWLTGYAIDHALPDKDSGLLAWIVVLVAVMGLLKALCLVGRRFIAGRQALAVEFDLRNALYSSLLRLSHGASTTATRPASSCRGRRSTSRACASSSATASSSSSSTS